MEGKDSYPLAPVWFLSLGGYLESQMVRVLGPPLPVGRKVRKGVLWSHWIGRFEHLALSSPKPSHFQPRS